MGYALLWIEHLAAVMLLVATLIACCSRLRQSRLRVALSVLVVLVPLIAYGLLICGLGYLRSKLIIIGVYYPLVFLAVCYVIGAVWILYNGLRQRNDDSTLAVAMTWPRGRLALMLAIATGLHMMTWWNLDLSVKQQLAVVRAESGALGLSVAPARVPDRENAALVYELAFEAFDRDSWPEALVEKSGKWTDFDASGFDFHDRDLLSFLAEQESTLILLRQAGRKRGCHFGRNYGRLNVDLRMPELGLLRDAACLLALDARVRAAKGEMQVALQNVGTMFAIAEHVGSDPILISTLVAIAINDIATETLEDVLMAAGKLGGDEAFADELLNTIDLDGSLSFRRLLGRALRGEEAVTLHVLQMVGSDPDRLSAEILEVLSLPAVSHSFYRLFMARSDVESYRKEMNAFSQIAAKPYHEARKDLEEFDRDFNLKPKGIVTALLMPVLSVGGGCALGDARHRTARLALTIARYRADHGDLPRNLDAMVPDYIAIIPRDPFDGKLMKYHLTKDGAVIYSIGPDGSDDNGAPLEENDAGTKAGDVTFKLRK